MNDSSATPDVEVSPAKRAHLEHDGITDHRHVVEWSLKTKKLKQELTKTRQKVSNLKKKLNISNQRSRRLKTKVKSLKTVVKVLKEKKHDFAKL
jgi:phage shock protein A